MRTCAYFVLLVLLFGCAATGESYQGQSAKLKPVDTDKARLFVFRTADSLLMSLRAARIQLNGREIGSNDRGGFAYFDVTPGKGVLSVDVVDFPGRCELSIELLAGQEYYFEVIPRAETHQAGFVGGMFGGLLGNIAARSAESAGIMCGGTFAVEARDRDTAMLKMRGLRSSN